ncbi:MAG: hypothetical protein Q7S28_00170, partial [bacterium]|nr:hypothetical protein [bacterium]
MICKICGSKLGANVEFCGNCGMISTAESLLSIALNDVIALKDLPPTQNVSPVQSLVDTEFRKAAYKIENNDLIGAQDIYENLAISYNVPMAWLYIGILKLIQLDLTGRITVNQALNDFKKAAQLLPDAKLFFQLRYTVLSICLIGKFC